MAPSSQKGTNMNNKVDQPSSAGAQLKGEARRLQDLLLIYRSNQATQGLPCSATSACLEWGGLGSTLENIKGAREVSDFKIL